MSATVWRAPPSRVRVTEAPDEVDVAIVGGGLTGLSCAYHVLQREPGAKVAVLDAAPLGQGASGHTTGMVTPGIGQDFAGVVRRLGLQRAAALYAETREAVRSVGEIIAAEGIDCAHEVVGQLIVAHGDAGPARLLRQARALEAAGQPCMRLDANALVERVSLATASTSGGLAALYLAEAAILDPLQFVEGLARAAQARGAAICTPARVVEVLHGSAPSLRLASGQVVRARAVVLATASESPHLAGLTGRIMPVRLKVLATAPLTDGQRAAVGWRSRECIVDSRKLFSYFRLTRDNRIVFGGGAPAYGADAAPGHDDLVRELRRTFPWGDELRVTHQWCGTIDYTLDGLPVVGPVGTHGNVLHAGGFCGHGVALGVRSGRWIAEAIARNGTRRFQPGLRSTPPLVPGEWLRRACFSVASGWMRLRGV